MPGPHNGLHSVNLVVCHPERSEGSDWLIFGG